MTAYQLQSESLDSDISASGQLSYHSTPLDPTDSGFPVDQQVLKAKETATTYAGSYSSEHSRSQGYFETQHYEDRRDEGKVFYDDQGNHFYANEDNTFYEEDTQFYELSQMSGLPNTGAGSAPQYTKEDIHTNHSGSRQHSRTSGGGSVASNDYSQQQSYMSGYRERLNNSNNDDWATSSVGSATYGSRTVHTDLDGLPYADDDETNTYDMTKMSSYSPTKASSAFQRFTQPETEIEHLDMSLGANQHYEQEHAQDQHYNEHPDGIRELPDPRQYGRPVYAEKENQRPASPPRAAASPASASSWEAETTRTLSLLDSEDSENEDENTYADNTVNDDDQTYDSYDSDDSSEMDVRDTLREVIKGMKNGDCNYGQSMGRSFDDETEAYMEFPFMPAAMQKFQQHLATSASTRDSKSRRKSGGRDGKRVNFSSPVSKKPPTKALFERVSALGEEFIQMQLSKGRDDESENGRRKSGRNRGDRSSQGRRKEPKSIIQSFSDIFSCGTPNF